eukprot:symbB.v1.2.008122.t1/scaffold500.1/size195150/12
MACLPISIVGPGLAGGVPAAEISRKARARIRSVTSGRRCKPPNTYAGQAAACFFLAASQASRRTSGLVSRAKADETDAMNGTKQSRGKAIMQDLWMKARQDIERRDTPGWEAELATRFQASDILQDFEVKEATGVDEVWGASQLLTDRDEQETFEATENAGDGNEANPFLGLGLMRAYSALSGDAPLTAIATSSEGVIGMAQVKKDGYVQNLVVKPNSRRKGVASQIVCWCATQSRRRGATQLWMHVEPGNEPALKFYQRLGFEVGDEEVYKERRAALPLKRATQIFELRRATEVLTSFGLSKKEHESMVNILQRAAQGDRTDGRVSRKNFLKEAASQSPNRSLKSRSPGAGGTKASWSCLRGVVRFGSTGLTGPGQKEKSDFAAWNLWPAKAEELPRSPTSSRPSSPRSQETKSSPHRTPEASLSPSRSRDLWWQIAPNAAPAI